MGWSNGQSMDELDNNRDILIIAGPTASGKSALALDIAEQASGVIINADSMQLYADLQILTARPEPADMRGLPHRLYGVLDGAVRCSVASWLELASKEVADARADGKLPILVGGTGFYLAAAENGISPIPDVSERIHAEAEAELKTHGGTRMRRWLAEQDPQTAARLPDGDSQRLVRAIGVLRQTGQPLSFWQEKPPVGQLDGRFVRLVQMPPRADIYQAIDDRLAAMVKTGALDEVARLTARQLDPSLPVMKALGVGHLACYLAGDMPLAEAVRLAQRDTRHYAKRQMTWIRNNFKTNILNDKKYNNKNFPEIFSKIVNFA